MKSFRAKELATECMGRTLMFVHPSLYRALKLTFLLDVGGTNTTLGWIDKELGQSNLGQAVGKLLPEYFEQTSGSTS